MLNIQNQAEEEARSLLQGYAKIICACYQTGGRANQGHLVDYKIATMAVGQSCQKHEPIEPELSFILCQFNFLTYLFSRHNYNGTIKGRLN